MRMIFFLLVLVAGCTSPVLEPPTPIAALLEEEEPDGLVVEVVEEEVESNEDDATLPAAIATISVREMRSRIHRREAIRQARWVIPTDPQELRTLTIRTLVRVTASEEGWANFVGMKALWQSTYSARGCLTEDNRGTSCRADDATRRRAPRVHGLWRHSPFASGQFEPRTRRQRWVSTITLDCEQPEGWPRLTRRGTPYAQWVSYEDHCEALVAEAERIVDGTDSIVACPPTSRPIAWGCDPFRRQAVRDVLGRERALGGCNDTPIAVRRQLQRLDCGETENAYWCRPGTPFCGTIPRSEMVLRERLRQEEDESDEEHGLRGGEDAVQDAQEGVQRGGTPGVRPVVLDLHGVPGDGERQAGGTSGDRPPSILGHDAPTET